MREALFTYIIYAKPIARVNPRVNGKIYYDPQSRKKKQLRAAFEAANPNFEPFNFPLSVHFSFYFLEPKKKLCAFMNRKPDLSNLIKFYEDTFNNMIWKDDKLICSYVNTFKSYADIERTEIKVYDEESVA